MLCLPKYANSHNKISLFFVLFRIVEVNEDDENQLNLSYSEQPTCEQLERPVSKETKPQTANAAGGQNALPLENCCITCFYSWWKTGNTFSHP